MDGLDPETTTGPEEPAGSRRRWSRSSPRSNQARAAICDGSQLRPADSPRRASWQSLAPQLAGHAAGALAAGDPACLRRPIPPGRSSRRACSTRVPVQQAQQQEQQRQAQVQHQQFETLWRPAGCASHRRCSAATRRQQTRPTNATSRSIWPSDGVAAGSRSCRCSRPIRCCHRQKRARPSGEAAQYRAIKSAPKAVPQALPTVQRPGVQRDGPRRWRQQLEDPSSAEAAGRRPGRTAAGIAGQIRSLKRSAT